MKKKYVKFIFHLIDVKKKLQVKKNSVTSYLLSKRQRLGRAS